MKKKSIGDEDPRSDLTRLIDLEDRIARDTEKAREEAEALLVEARRQVEDARVRQAERLESETEALRHRIESECLRTIGAIETEARQEIQRLERAGGERGGTLAARVVERLLETLPTDRGADDESRRHGDHQDVQSAHPGPAAEAV
jgi:F0F1-type ATP synthase membrane subunit b/b'